MEEKTRDRLAAGLEDTKRIDEQMERQKWVDDH